MSIRHTAYHLHIIRVIFAGLAIAAVGLVHLPSEAPVAKVTGTTRVLAYATSINITDLASGTNAARAQNGLGALSLSSKLNLSAQLKANDMIAKNYWAHVAPDGTQPWYWFSQAGYDYTSAGENLAYGFTTSDATMSGWMNSAGHRANILGSYQDMGFGIANGENYQGAQNTVVVAHYGTARAVAAAPVAPVPPSAPATTAVKPAQAQPQPTSTVTPTNAPTTPVQPASVPQRSDTPSAAQETQSKETAAVPATTAEKTTPVASVAKSNAVPAWQQLLHGTAPVLVIVSSIILVIVGIGYSLTHVSLVKHAAIVGEHYVMHHPLIDASITVGATILMLLTTIGHIG